MIVIVNIFWIIIIIIQAENRKENHIIVMIWIIEMNSSLERWMDKITNSFIKNITKVRIISKAIKRLIVSSRPRNVKKEKEIKKYKMRSSWQESYSFQIILFGLEPIHIWVINSDIRNNCKNKRNWVKYLIDLVRCLKDLKNGDQTLNHYKSSIIDYTLITLS